MLRVPVLLLSTNINFLVYSIIYPVSYGVDINRFKECIEWP